MPTGATRLILLLAPEARGWGQRRPGAVADRREDHNLDSNQIARLRR
jgi:hypothetical protein